MKKTPPVLPAKPSAFALAFQAHKNQILIISAILVVVVVAGVVVYKMKMSGAPNASSLAGTPAVPAASGLVTPTASSGTYTPPAPIVPYRAPGTSGQPLNSHFLMFK